jgi:hypothetical protein
MALPFVEQRHASSVMKSRQQELSDKANEERRRCTNWLLKFMQDDQPKLVTKEELCAVAIRELNVSRSSFNFAWMNAIDIAGREDWYEPLRKRSPTKN